MNRNEKRTPQVNLGPRMNALTCAMTVLLLVFIVFGIVRMVKLVGVMDNGSKPR